jgi:hypothetical protein
MHSSLLSDKQRQLVSKAMIYTEEPAGLLATSKIMQYKSPDYNSVFSGEMGNNVLKFTINGPGLLDPRSLYLQYSLQNLTVKPGATPGSAPAGVPLINCDPGSYSPFKRVRILSGFNQQVLYDCDGYNVMCAFLDDYLKSVHDLVIEDQGFYALSEAPISFATGQGSVPSQSLITTSSSAVTIVATAALSKLVVPISAGAPRLDPNFQHYPVLLDAPTYGTTPTAPAVAHLFPVLNPNTSGVAPTFTIVKQYTDDGASIYYECSQNLSNTITGATGSASIKIAFLPTHETIPTTLNAATSSGTQTLIVRTLDVQVGMSVYGLGIAETNTVSANAPTVTSITSQDLVARTSTIVISSATTQNQAVDQPVYFCVPDFESISGGFAQTYNMLNGDSEGARGQLGATGTEYLQWAFKPQLSGCGYNAFGLTSGLLGQDGAGRDARSDQVWPSQAKLFTICDLPYIGLFSQGKYLPLWGMGGLILELYLDTANNWCCPSDVNLMSANPSGGSNPYVQLADCKLFYDNVVPPADFLESMKNQINSEDGLSLVFPSVNRHLALLPRYSWTAGSVVSYTSTVRNEILIADHSRMAQTIFQIFRPQDLISHNARPFKLHNRTSAAIQGWQLKLNSSYIPQQPLLAVGGREAGAGVTACSGDLIQNQVIANQNYSLLNVRQYGQFHKELLKALGQQKRPIGSVTASMYELLTDSQQAGVNVPSNPFCNSQNYMKYGCRGSFAIGIDLTVADDVMTGTNLRNATVTGEMYANIDQFQHPGATATEVSTYVMKLSQIRLTSAGPIIVD